MEQKQYIQLRSGEKLAYEVSGSGPDMILMHGWGCESATLRSIATIASHGYKVYNIDLLGFGESDEPSYIWGVEDYVAMLEDFVTQLHIQSPILLGHSFGGRVAILYSSMHDDVKKVVLVDAAGVKPKRGIKYYCKVYSYKLMKKLTQLTLGKAKAEKKAEEMRQRRGSADYAQASPRMRQVLTKTVNQDLKFAMPNIKAPTLLVWGENDTATPLRDARVMNKLIPDSGLVSFPNCGHYSFLDNPYQFAAVLKSFLEIK